MEIWKPIEGHNYEISNHGRVRNKDNKVIVRGEVTEKGYLRVLMNKKHYKVHRLVGLFFIPNLDNKSEINHKDGNKLNNHVDNLEWVTSDENITHAVKQGLILSTDNRIVMGIYLDFNKGINKHELIKKYNVSRQMIDNIVSKRRHKKITDKLDQKIIS
ncbi:HNH endonuclease [Virgibacillus oceani]|uniref:HNH nuclease domain-containing protein n=1 Tax=Virgibacillus oceani TaxID=1479511 RepID=A0A917H1T1_9BACI|nr:HNH endonuclease [Virgibacillus oceani]GGG64683.1 hypothetical protein GCM10011398_05370 [Virgibacillus oceani]